MLAMGCMRLSTERNRDDARSIEVIHAALDAGVTLLDTADAYCLDHSDTGHNERLIAKALATWRGDRSRVSVATKGGLTRPNGEWVADGRARHLTAACDESRRALGVERIALYQLHAPDPRTPMTTSVRALAALQRAGIVDEIGLCNVTVGQLEDARTIAEIATVQVELSPWHDDNILSGVVAFCIANGIRVLAHRPLGGPQRQARRLADPVLQAIAARHGAEAADVALAWIRDLSDLITPLPGPTRVATARALGGELRLQLTAEDRAQLDERFPSGAILRRPALRPPAPREAAAGEVVLIMGLPGAGKSTVARAYVDQGYARLNRDEGGGSLRSLLPALDDLVASGHARIVLDNTYVSRKSRAALLQAAAKRGLPVRCVWLTTSVEDAQVNATTRMVRKFGRLLGPAEMKQTAKKDVSVFPPSVQFRYQRELEPPHESEGFWRIEPVPFARARDPEYVNRALVVWCDGVLIRERSAAASEIAIVEERADVLKRYARDGWRLLGIGWQPEVAQQAATAEQVEAGYARMRERLGVPIEILYCPHGAGPPICWCRKPLPGLGVVFVERYRLDPARCLYVGNGPQDPGFARKLGFEYREADQFFSEAR